MPAAVPRALKPRLRSEPWKREWEVTVVVRDTTGQDRALDLEAFYPIDLTGWTRWLDINTSQVMASFHRFKEKRYPFLAVSPPQGDTGLCMGVHPTQPFLYEIIVDASGITLKAPLGLTPLGEGPVKSRAEITFTSSRFQRLTDSAERSRFITPCSRGLRTTGHGRRYVAFSFPTEQLPNPHDYAYREGGPNGWKIDESSV